VQDDAQKRLVERVVARCRNRLADVLAALVQDTTFLVAPDSSIWERHWNGNEKNFTYTSAMAVAGLCGAAELAERMGETQAAERYRKAVSRLRRGIREKLVDAQGVLAGSLQELQSGSNYLDLAAVEAFNFGAIDVTDAVAASSMARWHSVFFDGVENGHGGYTARRPTGTTTEWCIVDLRKITAYTYMGQTARRIAARLVLRKAKKIDTSWLTVCRGLSIARSGATTGLGAHDWIRPGASLLALDARANPEPVQACRRSATTHWAAGTDRTTVRSRCPAAAAFPASSGKNDSRLFLSNRANPNPAKFLPFFLAIAMLHGMLRFRLHERTS
jgi:hypothetical protein